MTDFTLSKSRRTKLLDAILSVHHSDEEVAVNAVTQIIPLIVRYGDPALLAIADALADKIAADLGMDLTMQVHGPSIRIGTVGMEVGEQQYTLDTVPDGPLRYQLLAYEYLAARLNDDRPRKLELSRHGNDRGASLFSGLAYTMRLHHRQTLARNAGDMS